MDERFRPDMLKIYPTLVVKPSKLYEKWKKGEYTPLDEDETIELIMEMKKIVPEWVRIQRIERDIPSYMIDEGSLNLKFDFDKSTISGNMNFNANNKAWDMGVKSSHISNNGFQIDEFSGVDSAKATGNFYSLDGSSIGGRFDAKNGDENAHGIFIGKKQ